jgi:hypothetical protein
LIRVKRSQGPKGELGVTLARTSDGRHCDYFWPVVNILGFYCPDKDEDLYKSADERPAESKMAKAYKQAAFARVKNANRWRKFR